MENADQVEQTNRKVRCLLQVLWLAHDVASELHDADADAAIAACIAGIAQAWGIGEHGLPTVDQPEQRLPWRLN